MKRNIHLTSLLIPLLIITSLAILAVQKSKVTDQKPLRFGVYADSGVKFEQLGRSVNHDFQVISWFQHLDKEIYTEKIAYACSHNITPVITVEPWNGRDTTNPDWLKEQSLEKIVNGDYDEKLRTLFSRIDSNCKNEVIIRFAHEMSTKPGSKLWYPWQGNPELYKKAWLRTHKLAAEETSVVKWLWSPNTMDNNSDTYYPGSKYVDYVGVTINKNYQSWGQFKSFSTIYKTSDDKLKSYGKPIILPEIAVNDTLYGLRSIWVDDMFKTIKSDKSIYIAIWFNKLNPNDRKDIDYRFNTTTESLKNFEENFRDL